MRPGAAAVLLLVCLLAGCSGAPAPQGPGASQPAVVTDPRDLSYLDNATPGSHVHDYWGGRDRITVIQEEGDVWSTCTGSCADGMTGVSSVPEDGTIVPQGTRWVNGTWNFTPAAENDATTYELWIQTARDGEARYVQDLTPGTMFSFESTREQNDPPHYVLSLWSFRVVAKGTSDAVTFRGESDWTIHAVRGWPLTPYPPHPDRWGDADEMRLLSESRSAVLYEETDTSRACYGAPTGCPGEHDLPPDVVVPHDTDRVVARIEGVFPTLGLAFHGADTRAFRRVEGRPDGAATVFEVDLDTTLGDSPYASQSLWEFRVVLDQPLDERRWAGTYSLTVTAYR